METFYFNIRVWTHNNPYAPLSILNLTNKTSYWIQKEYLNNEYSCFQSLALIAGNRIKIIVYYLKLVIQSK